MAFEFELKCRTCGTTYNQNRIIFTCDHCPGLLDVLDKGAPREGNQFPRGRQSGLWKYAQLLPFGHDSRRISLGEGGTPLLSSSRLADKIGLGGLYLKCEYVNPTASFKDRGMSAAVSAAIVLGVTDVFCASTGNTAASLSAYAARGGLRAVLVLPTHVPIGKLSQAVLHEPTILRISGNFDAAMALVTDIGRRGYYLINSINPYRVEAQKTAAYEIAEDLDWKVPDHVILPAGSGGFLTAMYKGFADLARWDLITKMPRLGAVQSDNVAPIVTAARQGSRSIVPLREHAGTVAGGISIGCPVHGLDAVHAVHTTGGIAETVTEDEILTAQNELAQVEGIGVEPTAAVAFAGLKRARAAGTVSPRDTVVCVLTGHALKDTATIMHRGVREIAIEPGESTDGILGRL